MGHVTPHDMDGDGFRMPFSAELEEFTAVSVQLIKMGQFGKGLARRESLYVGDCMTAIIL